MAYFQSALAATRQKFFTETQAFKNRRYSSKNYTVGSGKIRTFSTDDESHRLNSGHETDNKKTDDELGLSRESFEEPSIIIAVLARFGFYILMILGFLNQAIFVPKVAREKNRKGYATLYERFDLFYFTYVYRRIRDCWNRPICSVPGAMVTLKERETHDFGWTFNFTGNEIPCINLGSYNYLGFAETSGACANDSIEAIQKYGCATCSTRTELGSLPIHDELEKMTAKFLGVEDAIVFGMGFATNSLNLPSLISKGCLVVSDERNHASLIVGLKLSGAVTRVFRHNDMHHLEKQLKRAVCEGQPDSGAPWRKIFIIVEGVYSMEGSIVHLPKVIELKKKYKAYIYLDEAHSTGALGKNGRGACDYFGVDPRDVDILMGTFTKSFGSAGGYIAGTKDLINHLRVYSHAHMYASSMSPPIAQQTLTSMRIICGKDGTDLGKQRTQQLARNTRYFRRRMHQMGFIIVGNDNSPVVPMIIYLFSKIVAASRKLLERNIAVVGVNFPATPLYEGRIRFCLSAAHTKEQLDYVLDNLNEIANDFGLKYSNLPRDNKPIEY